MIGATDLGGLSLWPADLSEPVRELCIGEKLRETAAAWPDRIALVDGAQGARDRRWNYGELLAIAGRIAAGLAASFRPGDRVALWAPNLPEWVFFEYGAALAGLTLVTVNPGLRETELEHVLADSGAVGIACLDANGAIPMRALVEAVRARVPALRRILSLREWASWSPVEPPSSDALPRVAPADLAMIIYTSGTTGAPKGAMLRHRGLVNNYIFNARRLGMDERDVFVSQIPLFHVGGACMAVLTALAAGAALVLGEKISPTLALDLMERERATTAIGVPTMYFDILALLDEAPRDLSAMRRIMIGGAPVPPALIHALETRLGAQVHNSFGQTETGSIVCTTEIGDPPETVARTVGRPLPQAEVRIVGTNGAILPLGQAGELCVRGYQVMAGYTNGQATRAAIDADGWLRTGDVCAMDTDGRIRIAGRIKEMIIRGGENLFPQEIENAIRAHPAVADIAVVGVPHARLGEVAAAFVVVAPGQPPTGQELQLFLRGAIAAEKVPEHWRFVESLPMTASGKIDKPALRAGFGMASPGG